MEISTIVVDSSVSILPAQTTTQAVSTKNEKAIAPKLRPKLHRKTVPSTGFREDGIPKALSETITAIQDVVRKLGWPIEQINNFIVQKFHGRRRTQLSDEELVELLYYLRVQCLESVRVGSSKTQSLQVLSHAPIG